MTRGSGGQRFPITIEYNHGVSSEVATWGVSRDRPGDLDPLAYPGISGDVRGWER